MEMIDRLVERDGWLYVEHENIHLFEPKKTLIYWPLKVRFVEFAARFRSVEEARARLGSPVVHHGDGRYRDEHGLQYRLVAGGVTRPTFTETIDIPPPAQRGRQLPVRWRDRHWEKETARGWCLA
jgi:hypothetical protein